MKMIMRKTLVLFCATIMLIGTLVPVDIVCAADTAVKSTDWMAGVSGDTKLSSVSIPGTHDSSARYVFPSLIMQCQDTSIATQMKNGFRYFDIRLALDEKDGNATLKLRHNFANCRETASCFSDNMQFADVVKDAYKFLDAHPTETLIFCVKAENSKDDVATIQSLLDEQIDANPSYWYTQNVIPNMDEVRGKIVLASRMEDVNQVGGSKNGLSFLWENQNNKEVADLAFTQSMINDTETLWVQDRFKYNVEMKMDAMEETIENAQPGDDTFVLNFLSTAGSGFAGHPKKYAKIINQKLLDTKLSSKTSYGIIICDFGTQKIAEHIYQTNF